MKINTGSAEITLNETSDVTFPEAQEQLNVAVGLISKFVKPVHQAEVWMRMITEMLHWMYANTGEHPSPVDILKQDIGIPEEAAAADWPLMPVFDLDTKKGSKTND